MSKEETKKAKDHTSDKQTSKVEERKYYRPNHNHKHKNGEHPPYASKMFELMDTHMSTDLQTIQLHIVKHLQFNMARSRISMDHNACFKAVSLSVRDYLIESNNDTRSHILSVNPKIAYYFSMEYLPGRALKNAILSLDLEENYIKALDELGYKLEDLYDEEVDPGLGNGGLGRLASCLLDSLATHNYPVWGYGIRYDYGIFKQKIVQGGQCEVPDYWLVDGYPWEIRRNDVGYRIGFYGKVERKSEKGKEIVVWKPEEEVHALAFDQLVPGYNTYNTVSLRLWRSRPAQEFDLTSFNQGDYDKVLQAKQRAEFITSVLYPNDESDEGKELRLKQQYFHVSASLQDILARFKVVNEDLNLLPEKVAVQLNDTHPSLGILELMRIFLDIEGLEWDHAWGLVTKVFGYTNHTVMPEALEKWDKKLFEHLLPRHMELALEVNKRFLKEVSKKFPNDEERLKRMTVIDDKKVHMAYLAIVGSHIVNGVAEIHSDLLKKTIFKDYYELWPEKFQNKTNGVTHRRWVGCANMELAQFYTDELGSREWLSNMDAIKGLLSKVDDAGFRKKWAEIKMNNKRRLIEWVEEHCGVTLDENSMFDIMTKRIHEYKRQLMNIMHVIYRYQQLKEASPEERKKFVPRSVLIGGKAATGYVIAKGVIRLIVAVGKVINEDEDTKDLLKVVFLPNYSVGTAEVIIPAADITENISKAGTEASGTSNMKYCMNGALLMGTMDGANVEIVEEIGEKNAFIFGAKIEEVEDIERKNEDKKVDKRMYPEFFKAFEAVKEGKFGEHEEITALIESIEGHKDEYLVAYDFKSYIEAQQKADELFKNKEEWTKKSILTALNCSKFSSDRTVKEYARDIWKIDPVKTPLPKEESYRDWKVNVKKFEKDGEIENNQDSDQRNDKP